MKEVIDPDYLPEIPIEKLPSGVGGGTVLYENYDGTPPEDGVISCDLSPYKYIEVLFIRNDNMGSTHGALAWMLVGKAAAARANIVLNDAPGTISIVQAALEYDATTQSFTIGMSLLMSYDTANNMACTPGPDEHIFPARIVGYK